eukprot:459659_1
MYEMKKEEENPRTILFIKQHSQHQSNLFRKKIFDIFKYCGTLIVYTTDRHGYDAYPLSFLSLLSEIEQISFTKIIIKAVHPREWTPNPSWISFMWEKHGHDLTGNYQQKKLNISFTNTKNEKGYKEDCVVISKMF